MLAVVPDNQDESRRGVHLRAPSGDMCVSGKAEVGQSVCTDISISMLRGIRMSSESTTTANLQACWRTCRPSSSEWLLRYFAVRASGPKCGIAPAHSFDRTTVDLLRGVRPRRISDRFFLFPNLGSPGMFWIPQQLWRFRPMPFGVWC